MTATLKLQLNASFQGKSFSEILQKTGSSGLLQDVSVPAAKTGTLTTRTDNDTGVVTLDSGHGLTNGTFDLYWADGKRFGMTGTIATNALSLDGGAGDNLPTTTTAVTATKRTKVDGVTFTGDDLEMLLAYLSGRGAIAIATSGTTDKEYYFKAAGVRYWSDDSEEVNPVASDSPNEVWFSNGTTSAINGRLALILT